MVKRVPKTAGVSGIPMTSGEYAKFRKDILDIKNFNNVLTVELPPKNKKDVASIIRHLRSYFALLQKKDFPTEIVSEKHYTISGAHREFILKISPIFKIARQGVIVNYHYIVIKQFVRDGTPFISIDFYLNRQSEKDGLQMDSILSILAKHLQEEGLRVPKEQLIKFDPRE